LKQWFDGQLHTGVSSLYPGAQPQAPVKQVFGKSAAD
jgi:hypothetical protein